MDKIKTLIRAALFTLFIVAIIAVIGYGLFTKA